MTCHRRGLVGTFVLAALAAFAILAATAPAQEALFRPPQPRQPEPPSTLPAPPEATVAGRTIRLIPSGATFQIPESWARQERRGNRNLHLTRDELERVRYAEGDWDSKYARVVNAMLPFEMCAAHVGSEGWGNSGALYIDLQMRAYVTDFTAEQVREFITLYGEEEATRVGTSVSLVPSKFEKWDRYWLSFDLHFGDYTATANVEAYVRPFGEQTAVLIFMYGSHPRSEGSLAPGIVKSFSWKN